MARGEDTGSHPNRQVGRPSYDQHTQKMHDTQLQKMNAEYGSRMGVPTQWVKDHRTAGFSGSVKGFVGEKGKGHLVFSAESTGGGETDSHMIPFNHPFMDSSQKHSFDKFFGVGTGKQWTVKGQMSPNGIRADSGSSMHWTLHEPPREGN